MGPRKRSQKKADGQEANLNRLVLLTLFFFFFNHTQNLHILQSFQNANQNSEVLPHTGQNDLCKKFTNIKCWKILEKREFSCTDATKLNC